MDEKYFKIGDFARLAGVNVKALRYYDRIGVLRPDHVDADTGYRYYRPEQKILADVVQLCLTFQLPLRELGAAKGDARQLRRLILDGASQARQKIREAEQTLRLTDDILAQIERLDRPQPDKTLYPAAFGPRAFLLLPWASGQAGGSDYVEKIAQLHSLARARGAALLTQQGLLLDRQTGRQFVFLAIGDADVPDSFSLPAADYACMALRERELSSVPALLDERGVAGRFLFFLNTDIYDYCLVHHLHRVEVQCPLSLPDPLPEPVCAV